MDIDKDELKQRFQKKDWNYVYGKAYEITDYLCSRVYKMTNPVEREDVVQECVVNLHKKISQNKVDENNNIFSFIYTNSNYRILEILRKERTRAKKATFVSLDCRDNFDNIVYGKVAKNIMEED